MLIIEDDVPAAEMTVRALETAGLACAHEVVCSERMFRGALARTPDIILSDSNVPGFDGMAALNIARTEFPQVPFIFVSGSDQEAKMRAALDGGAAAYVCKSNLGKLAPAVLSALGSAPKGKTAGPERRQPPGGAKAPDLSDHRIPSAIDELTRCGSRRLFDHQFPREVDRAIRFHRPLALLMCDIDHLKCINDSHGLPAGDEVLRQFADRLTKSLRLGGDWVARIGGEEFAVVLPEVGSTEALSIARRLCERVSSSAFVASSQTLGVTASFGVCALGNLRGTPKEVHDVILNAAEAALARSKRDGCNRVAAAQYLTDGIEPTRDPVAPPTP